MRSILLTVATTCALIVGGLSWTDSADARPWRRGGWRAPVARYYGGYYSRPYYGYRSYYRPYYGYRSYYRPYYYGSSPYYYSYPTYRWGSRYPYYGGGVYFSF